MKSRALAAQVVFAEAWWVGTKESNPEETQLPIPDSVLQAGARAAGVRATSLRSEHVYACLRVPRLKSSCFSQRRQQRLKPPQMLRCGPRTRPCV